MKLNITSISITETLKPPRKKEVAMDDGCLGVLVEWEKNGKRAAINATLKPPGDSELARRNGAQKCRNEWHRQFNKIKNELAGKGFDYGSIHINTIDLSNEAYTVDGAKTLQEILVESKALAAITSVNLSRTIVSQENEETLKGFKLICDMFAAHCPQLEYIDLSGNDLGSEALNACTLIFTNCQQLHSVRLCSIGLPSKVIEQVVDCLLSSGIAARLRLIHLHDNVSDEDNGCKAFVKLLKHSSPAHLKSIRFSGMRASNVISLMLVEAMHTHMIARAASFNGNEIITGWNVEHLDLADCTFGNNGGAASLTFLLSQCHSLVHLDVSGCCLNDENASKICWALIRSKCPLKCLNVSGNGISPAGCMAGLVPLLKDKASTLEKLLAEENELCLQGVGWLAESLGELWRRAALREINLASNGCDALGSMAWISLKVKGKCPHSLTKLNLDGNPIPEDAKEDLQQAYGATLVDIEHKDAVGHAGDDASSSTCDEGDDSSTSLDNLFTNMNSFTV
jgi:Ran GTPase-activating protein (RanGAP) involved in mRNA processing and transport